MDQVNIVHKTSPEFVLFKAFAEFIIYSNKKAKRPNFHVELNKMLQFDMADRTLINLFSKVEREDFVFTLSFARYNKFCKIFFEKYKSLNFDDQENYKPLLESFLNWKDELDRKHGFVDSVTSPIPLDKQDEIQVQNVSQNQQDEGFFNYEFIEDPDASVQSPNAPLYDDALNQELNGIIEDLQFYYFKNFENCQAEVASFQRFRNDVALRQASTAHFTQGHFAHICQEWIERIIFNNWYFVEREQEGFIRKTLAFKRSDNAYKKSIKGFFYSPSLKRKSLQNFYPGTVDLNLFNRSLCFEFFDESLQQYEAMWFNLDNFKNRDKVYLFGHKLVFELETHRMKISFISIYQTKPDNNDLSKELKIEHLATTDTRIPALVRAALNDPKDIIVERNPFKDITSSISRALDYSPYYLK